MSKQKQQQQTSKDSHNIHLDKDYWNPDHYAEKARFVADLGQPLIELLGTVSPQNVILDLGCGDGALSEIIANSLGCSVVGVDSSPSQIESARRSWEKRKKSQTSKKGQGIMSTGELFYYVCDGQDLNFEGKFDAVFSNAAMHWMKDRPQDVIKGVWKALKPMNGCRFVSEFGGKGNVSKVVKGLEQALEKRGMARGKICDLNPWYFPSPDEYKELLEENGFKVKSLNLFPRPVEMQMSDWITTFAPSFLLCLPEEDRQDFVDDVCTILKPELYNSESDTWTVDYVRLRFVAEKVV